MPIEQPLFLRDVDHGGRPDQATAVADALVAFVRQAQTSVHIAIYDFRLSPALGDALITALSERAAARVDVKIAYDHTKPNTAQATAFAVLGGDPAPKGTDVFLRDHFAGSRVQLKPVLTIPGSLADTQVGTEPIAGSHLMHNKYVLRDGAAVWTGSTNFTDDAWSHQENNVVRIISPELCAYFEQDFKDLWLKGNIASSGAHDRGQVRVDGAVVGVAFAPGEGAAVDDQLAALVSSARRRIRVASMVLSSHKILAALSGALAAGIPVTGVYDATQMDGIRRAWARTGNPAVAAFDRVAERLVGKASQPYAPAGVHNFMHNKVLVVDDAVATGSFNLSTNATHNAENSLVLHDAALADAYAAYIDALIAAYR